MPRQRIFLAGALVAALTACTPGAPTSPPTTSGGAGSPSVSAGAPASVTGSATPSSATPVSPSLPPDPFAAIDRLVLSAPAALSPAWAEVFALAYGDAPDRLGTSMGGDDGGLRIGPSYGTQVPDGSWWFLDAANRRLAHFSDAGRYLGEVRLPPQYLADGEYFQYQSPHALADGTLVLQSTTPGDSALLRLAPDGTLSRVPLASFVAVKVGDGTHLYGFDQDNGLVRLDPLTGAITPADAFVGQGLIAFTVTVAPGRLGLTRPGVTLDVPVIAAGRPASVVHPAVEAATGADGVLNLLISGMIEDAPGEITEVVGFARFDAAGRGFVEPVRALSGTADPSDGSRLGVRLGDSRPWLMVIDTDAVRVYRRR